MKTLLVYATNSGSTLEVANQITGQITQKGNEVVTKDAREVEPDVFKDYDMIILGSPTYDEGNVHDSYNDVIQKSEGKTFADKKFAVFALGDNSYQVFCGAADKLVEYVKKINGQSVGEPLKINNYYFNQQDELPKITSWSQELLK